MGDVGVDGWMFVIRKPPTKPGIVVKGVNVSMYIGHEHGDKNLHRHKQKKIEMKYKNALNKFSQTSK